MAAVYLIYMNFKVFAGMSDLKLLRANFSDAALLAEICKKAFDYISEKYSGYKEGPSGYDTPHWHTVSMKEGVYFQILLDDKIIGAIIIAIREKKRVTDNELYHWELVQMFIDPDYQGKGIGSFAIKEVERYFPEMYLLTTATPAKYISNNNFYEKSGFKKVKEIESNDLILFFYEKYYDLSMV